MAVQARRQLQRSESIVTTTPVPVPTATPEDRSGPSSPSALESQGHIGWVIAGALTTGFVAALLLVAAPFVPDEGGYQPAGTLFSRPVLATHSRLGVARLGERRR
jgi:hypothetical protein